MYIPIDLDYSVFSAFRINKSTVDFILYTRNSHYPGDTVDTQGRKNTREIYSARLNYYQNFFKTTLGAAQISTEALECMIYRITNIDNLKKVANFIIEETDKSEPHCPMMYYRGILGSLIEQYIEQCPVSPMLVAFQHNRAQASLSSMSTGEAEPVAKPTEKKVLTASPF